MNEHKVKDFIFVGEVLILDLINTLKMVRGKKQDLLETPWDLLDWWKAAGQHYPDTFETLKGDAAIFDGGLLESVKQLRDHMRQLFLRMIDGAMPEKADLEFLNAILRSAHPAVEWHAQGAPQMRYIPDNPNIHLTLLLALSAMHLLTAGDLSRLRQCHSHHIDRCILLFYDTTKSATRQWCSTACLDRERAARRYEEKKRTSEN